MNQLHLGHRLGAVGSSTLQRYQNERLLYSLEHQPALVFTLSKPSQTQPDGQSETSIRTQAHAGGVNCLAFHQEDARHLVSAGGDASIRLWDLESSMTATASSLTPAASLTRNTESAHTHAITSISVYPFDPIPTTLLSTSFDDSLKLTAVTPTSLEPLHTFPLGYAVYSHAVSPVPTTTPLIAVGTAHPAIRLLDLRSGLSTHSLPGHNGAIYSLAWSPVTAHLLVSGSHDGRVLFFDVRRANAAFASLDLDDAVGFDPSEPSQSSSNFQNLNFSALAHTGPVTSVQFHPTPSGTPTSLVTAGHDQRIRLWDLATGRNELVHFGPRIRNTRIGTLSPLLAPQGYTTKPSQAPLFWPNDDARGEIMMHTLREGNMLRILRLRDADRLDMAKEKSKVSKLTSRGRINQLVWRAGEGTSARGLEMYSAHGDGSICPWKAEVDGDESDGDDDEGESSGGKGKSLKAGVGFGEEELEREKKRKRNAELLGELVQGLTKTARPAR